MKPGYKQTEVGQIPADWGDPQLQEIAKDESPICYGIVQVGRYVPNGIPVLAIKNINFTNAENIHRSSEEVERPYSRSRVHAGDVLVSVKGTTGRIGIIPSSFSGNISRDLARIRPREDVSSRFVFQMLKSDLAQRRLNVAVVGTTRMELSIAILKNVRIPVPPTKAEQEAIAEALSDADALIESLEHLIAKKRHLKQGAMQDLLTGKKRLPGFSGEWVSKPLKAIVETPITDGPHLTPKFWDDGIPFLSVNNLVDNRIDLRELRYVSRSDHEEFSKKCRPCKHDILLGKAASVGKVAIVDLDLEFNIWSPIALIRVCPEHSPRFVFYLLQGTDLTKQIALLTNSSSQGNIGMVDIEKLVLCLPQLPEQIAIVSILSDMDEEIAALEAKLAKARQLKQGKMQELLTGRIRLT